MHCPFVSTQTISQIIFTSFSFSIAADQWFSPGTLVSSTNKTDSVSHNITEILLKMVLNTITILFNSEYSTVFFNNYLDWPFLLEYWRYISVMFLTFQPSSPLKVSAKSEINTRLTTVPVPMALKWQGLTV